MKKYPPKHLSGRSALKTSAFRKKSLLKSKRIEQRLREQEHFLSAVVNTSPAIVYVYDLETQSNVYCSTGIRKILGYSPDQVQEMEAKLFAGMIHPDDLQEVIALQSKIRTMGDDEILESEHRARHADGSWRVLHTYERPFMINTDGSLKQKIGVAIDITERKRAEEELSKTLAMLRKEKNAIDSIFQAVPIGLAMVDDKGGNVLSNAEFEKVWGSPRPGIKMWDDYSHYKAWWPDGTLVQPREWASTQAIREGLAVINQEMEIRRFDGTRAFVLNSAVPIYDSGKVSGAAVSIMDISERKMAEKTLGMAKSELEQKITERTQKLLEININLVKEMEQRKLAEEKLLLARQNLRAMASEIVLADERSRKNFAVILHDAVVQTLGAAKIKAQLVQTRIPKDAQPIFDDFLDMLTQCLVQARSVMTEMSPPVLNELGLIPALEWLTEQFRKQHGINVKFESNKKNVSLAHDMKVFLFQVTRELLMNIVKHAKASSVSVKFSRNGKKVSIQVSDDGLGFEIEDAFRPDLKGGYGLYSIRERLQHIGGELTVESRLGQGTTIHVMAPRAIENDIPL